MKIDVTTVGNLPQLSTKCHFTIAFSKVATAIKTTTKATSYGQSGCGSSSATPPPQKTLTHVGENRCRPAAGKVTPVHSLHNHIEYDTKLMVYQLLRGITENRIKQK